MSVKWTEQQQKAIDTNGSNVLVSAAAGSGKTAVLVERVIKKITDPDSPVQIDRMLIATFTNAAANGMQIKIREALKKQLDLQSDNEYLAKQLALLPRATITTVHSFCQDLIRNNFHKLGLSATFEIGDETQLSILQKQALDEVFENRYENPSSAFDALAGGYGGKRDDRDLADFVMNIYRFTQSTADPYQWLENAKNLFSGEGFSLWSDIIIRSVKNEIHGMIGSYNSAIEVIEDGNGIEKYFDVFCLEREMLSQIIKTELAWDEMRELIHNFSFARLPSKSKDADTTCTAFVQGIRKDVKKHIGKLCNTLYSTEADIAEDNKILSGIMGELCDITADFTTAYSLLKNSKNLVDFNDLEHYTLKLLSDSDMVNEIKNKFDEVLVDEYQDTNGVQEAIFQAVSKGNNLFMVGDVKQSIYGFRNAQPSIFTNKAKEYEENEMLGTPISLSHNFRSCGGVIDFINEVFSQIMSESLGSVDYNNGHSLISKRSCQSGDNVTEIHIIDKKLEDNGELSDEEQLTDEILREAMFVARRIVELVEVEKPDIVINDETGKTRKLQYSDIAILARKNKGVSDVFANQLAQYGVPFYCEDETGDYIASSEIATVLSFLQIIDNPLQDIPLLAVMRSPMFLFTDGELAHIKTASNLSFYDAVCNMKSDKCENFLSKLAYYREMSKRESIEHLIRTILSDTGYLSFTGSLPNGETRVSNLRLLCERAGKFEANEYKSIFDFINYINAMAENSQSYSVAKIASQNDNVVRMMSIHKSKGLEFPVVFFVRCGGRFNKSDLSAYIQYDIDIGLGCDFVDIKRGIKYPSISKLAITQKKLNSLLSEEMRVMYVAMTRAKDMLFIVGSCVNVEKKIDEWENSDSTPYTISHQNTYLDWIGISLKNKIRTLANVHSAFDIVLKNREGIIAEQTSFFDDENDTDYSDEIAKRLEYVYPYSNAKFIPSKLPVSQAIIETQYAVKLKKPDFMQKRDKMSAAVRGTIIHFVMQNIDISKTDSISEIEAQINEMVSKGMLDKNFVDVVSIKALDDFFKSDIGRRMKASPNVQQEVKFFVDVPAHEIINDLDESVSNETILLQGVVDCFFVEDNKLVILDYKTGNADKPEYQKQLEFYAKGLSKILNKEVKETLLYPLI